MKKEWLSDYLKREAERREARKLADHKALMATEQARQMTDMERYLQERAATQRPGGRG